MSAAEGPRRRRGGQPPARGDDVALQDVPEADEDVVPTSDEIRLVLHPAGTKSARLAALLFLGMVFACMLTGQILRYAYRHQHDGYPVLDFSELAADSEIDPGTVAVVGGGLAGLAASIGALSGGASRVVMFDKVRVSGNSIKATSGMNAVGDAVQLADPEGSKDSIEAFTQDVLKSGKGLSVPALAHALAARSRRAVALLGELGVHFTSVERLGGSSFPRTHRIDGVLAMGATLVKACTEFLKSFEGGRFSTFEASEVVAWDVDHLNPDAVSSSDFDGKPLRRVTEIAYTTENKHGGSKRIRVKVPIAAVVLTSGGYAADRAPDGVMSQCKADYMKFPTTNGAFATGDAVKLGIQSGLDTIHLDQVQLHPTAFVDPNDPLKFEKWLCPEVFRGVGAILVNRDGSRFVNELRTRDEVSAAEIANGATPAEWGLVGCRTAEHGQAACEGMTGIVALVLNEETRHRIGESTVDFYESRGFVERTGNLENTAARLEVPISNLRATLTDYAKCHDGLMADPLGKTAFPTRIGPDDETYYVAFVTPATHYTMGGIKVNSDCQACWSGQPTARRATFCSSDAEDESAACGGVILNLFVAGEAAGGLHGANRLGGNGILESLTFGWHAGKRAAAAAARVAGLTVSSLPKNEMLRSLTSLEVREIRPAEPPLEVPADRILAGLAELPSPHDKLRVLRLNLPSPLDTWLGHVGSSFLMKPRGKNGPTAVGGIVTPSRGEVGFVDAMIALPDCQQPRQKSDDCAAASHWIWNVQPGDLIDVIAVPDMEAVVVLKRLEKELNENPEEVHNVRLVGMAGDHSLGPVTQVVRLLARYADGGAKIHLTVQFWTPGASQQEPLEQRLSSFVRRAWASSGAGCSLVLDMLTEAKYSHAPEASDESLIVFAPVVLSDSNHQRSS